MVGQAVGRSVYAHVITNFLGWVDYHISLAMGLRPRAAQGTARGAPLQSQGRGSLVSKTEASRKIRIKTEPIRKLSNSNFQWTKASYQNNFNHAAFLFTLFDGDKLKKCTKEWHMA